MANHITKQKILRDNLCHSWTGNIKSFDLVILATDHDDFDYDLIEKEAKLIVDTRGRFNKSDKIVNA